VTITTHSSKNGATTLSRMNLSGYIAHVTIIIIIIIIIIVNYATQAAHRTHTQDIKNHKT